jgi:hypothetical protein
MKVIDTVAEPERDESSASADGGSTPSARPRSVETSLPSRYSGTYTARRDGDSYVYEASWQNTAGYLLWNCTIWRSDFLTAFRGGSAPSIGNDPQQRVSAFIEAEIEAMAAKDTTPVVREIKAAAVAPRMENSVLRRSFGKYRTSTAAGAAAYGYDAIWRTGATSLKWSCTVMRRGVPVLVERGTCPRNPGQEERDLHRFIGAAIEGEALLISPRAL